MSGVAMPTGWVRRWPSGYLGPRGEVIGRQGRWWVGQTRIPSGEWTATYALTLTELWRRLGYGTDGGAA